MSLVVVFFSLSRQAEAVKQCLLGLSKHDCFFTIYKVCGTHYGNPNHFKHGTVFRKPPKTETRNQLTCNHILLVFIVRVQLSLNDQIELFLKFCPLISKTALGQISLRGEKRRINET